MNSILKNLFPLLFIILIASCNPEDDPSNDTPTKNYLPPTGNDLVLFESDLGNKLSLIREMIDDGSGNFFFRGKVNDKSVIGKINISGDILWQREMNYAVKSIKKVYAENAAIHNALLICGNTSEEESGSSGFVSIYDANGSLLSSKVFDEYQTVLFNDVGTSQHISKSETEIASYTFIAFGGAGNGTNDIYPYLTYFSINPSGQISQNFPSNVTINRKSYRFIDYAHFRFGEVAKKHGWGETGLGNGGGKIEDEFTSNYLASLAEISPSNSDYLSTRMISLTEPFTGDYDNYNFTFHSFINEWSTEILNSSSEFENFARNIALGDGIYVIGYKETEEGKTDGNPTSGGEYWHGGYITKLDFDGNILYNRTLSVSPYDDKLFDVVLDDDFLYLSGRSSSYLHTTSDDKEYSYGYGWIAKVGKNSGSMMNSVFIGDESEESSFYTIEEQNNRLFVGGYKYNNKDKKRKAYFWEIDKNKL